jgi:hypothetical protein
MSSEMASSPQLYQLSAHVVGFGAAESACRLWSFRMRPMQHWSMKMRMRQIDAILGYSPRLLLRPVEAEVLGTSLHFSWNSRSWNALSSFLQPQQTRADETMSPEGGRIPSFSMSPWTPDVQAYESARQMR